MIELSIHSRRKFLKNIGYVSVGFPLLSSCLGEQESNMGSRVNYDGSLPGSMTGAPKVDAWIEILADASVRVFSGKVELGQGIRTAIRQVAAEELDMDLDRVEVHLAETGITPNEGYTAASASIQNSAMSVRYAAATARQKLLELAAKKFDTSIDRLMLSNGIVKSKTTKKSINFAELLDGVQIDTVVATPVPIKNKTDYMYVGKAIPRPDIDKMVRGEQVYVQDLRFPGMLHARVLRPPNYESKLMKVDDSNLMKEVAGVVKTVKIGDFIGVITEREYQAVRAEKYLRINSEWVVPELFPESGNLYNHIREISDEPQTIRNDGDVQTAFGESESIKATYTKPYLAHGSMGPACAVAMYDGDILHLWSHSQGIYPMREALAAMLDMALDKIHIVGIPGAGCFGHSTADDAAADAAILALEMPGKHIRLQWSRENELAWDPFGSAIILDLEASLDKLGKINSWKSDVWTDSHSTRPNSDAGTLLTARYLEKPFEMQSRGYLAGGHRNADPYYSISNLQMNAHFFDGPLRVSSLRSLGAFANIFAIESFMDQLAEKAGKDPLDFRLAHLDDERAVAVLKNVKEMTQSISLDEGEGLGYAFMRYKNSSAYCAVAAKVYVDKSTGAVKVKKMWAAVDVGEVINLDGITNQTEGGMIQAASWTIKEQVTYSNKEVTSTNWGSYPIYRFPEIPEVEVTVIDRPEEPVEGGGEAALPPSCGAIANAVYNACGRRIFDLPIKAINF